MSKNVKKKYIRRLNTDSIYTGIPDLDRKTGGFERGKIVTLGGRPGSGKTMFTITCLCNLIDKGNDCILYFSLDKDKTCFLYRLIRSYARVDIDEPSCNGMDKENMHKAMKKLSLTGIKVHDAAKKRRSIKSIKKVCNKYARNNKTIDLIVISSFELIDMKDNKEDVVKTLKLLKQLAIDNDCCVLLLTNLKGDIEKREDPVPMLTDFKYKRSITTYSDHIWALHNGDYINQDSLSRLYILKGNQGYINLVPLRRYGVMASPKG